MSKKGLTMIQAGASWKLLGDNEKAEYSGKSLTGDSSSGSSNSENHKTIK